MYIGDVASAKLIQDLAPNGHKFPSILKAYHKSSNSVDAIEEQSIKWNFPHCIPKNWKLMFSLNLEFIKEKCSQLPEASCFK